MHAAILARVSCARPEPAKPRTVHAVSCVVYRIEQGQTICHDQMGSFVSIQGDFWRRKREHMREQRASEFEKIAANQREGTVLSEFWYMLQSSRKWWLLPIIVLLLGFGTLMLLGGTAAAPFIYTLF